MPKHLGEDTDLSIGYGTRLDKLDEPLILYPARGRAIAGLHSRFVKLLPLLLVLYAALLMADPLQWPFIGCLTIMQVIMYLCVRRTHSRAVVPIMTLRLDGIEVHSLYIDMFIPWTEIKEVRTYNIGTGEMDVGIVPFDLSSTLARGSLRTRIFAWMSVACMPFGRLFGIFTPPLIILESELPLAAEDIVEQINLRRAFALGLDRSIESSE